MKSEDITPQMANNEDFDWQLIIFKECTVHTMLRYAGDKCPVCAAIEDRDLELGRLEEDKVHLEGTIADLENRLSEYETL